MKLTESQRSKYVGYLLRRVAPNVVVGAATDKGVRKRTTRLSGGRGSGWAATLKNTPRGYREMMRFMYGLPRDVVGLKEEVNDAIR